MPNPFPGMDPYLEGPLWTTVHTSLVNEIARQLAPQLRPKYFALPQERIDALVPESVPNPYVEIRDAEQRRLVTMIGVLSPTNKRGPGVEEYRKKRQEILASDVHYLEIDLLRVGERFPLAGTLPSVPYFVFLSRANRRPRVEAWPTPLEQPLPRVPVPLLPDDGDVLLDMQEALQTIYECYSYDRATDHSGEPPVRLAPEQQAWADERLLAAGLCS